MVIQVSVDAVFPERLKVRAVAASSKIFGIIFHILIVLPRVVSVNLFTAFEARSFFLTLPLGLQSEEEKHRKLVLDGSRMKRPWRLVCFKGEQIKRRALPLRTHSTPRSWNSDSM